MEELVISATVRDWARSAFPDVPVVAATAATVAISAFEAWASVSEACRAGRRSIDCCRRHPSAAATGGSGKRAA